MLKQFIQIYFALKAFFVGLVCFSALFLFPLSAATVDRAVFTVERQVYFQSDIKAIVGSLKRFQCVYKNATLLQQTRITRSILRSVTDDFIPEDLIRYIALIEKMKRDIEDQFEINFQELWKEIAPSGCLQNGPTGWSDNLKSFFLLEVYLNQKFIAGTDSDKQKARLKWIEQVENKFKHHYFKLNDK